MTPNAGEPRRLIAESLRAWGISSWDDEPRKFATDPSVSALRLAMRLPEDDWDVDRLVAVLRNGLIKPDWPEIHHPFALAATASAICGTHVFRSADAIRESLVRIISQFEDNDGHSRQRKIMRSRASVALPIFNRLVSTLESSSRSGTWAVLVKRLFRLAETLGIGSVKIDAFFLELEDQGEILAQLDQGGEEWTWSEFVDEIDAVSRAIDIPRQKPIIQGVRVLPFAAVQGSVFRHVIVADLSEGSYPSKLAFEGVQTDHEARGQIIEREKRRFLALGSLASESVTLAFPTQDAKGHPLLASGYLDDVRRLFTDDAWSRATKRIEHLDVVLPEDLAVEGNEARIRAVALSCLDRKSLLLDTLSRDPKHREPLIGTARALRLAHWRTRRTRFDRYDGRLGDPRIAALIASMFGSVEHPFSASQLESLALCPFQFFQRYVLALDPPESHSEIEEDHTTRGQMLHQALESLHLAIRDVPDGSRLSPAARVTRGIGPALDNLFGEIGEPESDIDAGLFAIETERIRRLGRRYAKQYERYAEKEGRDAEGKYFEVAFGRPGNPYPPLEIGEPPRTLAISGVIDRIDVLHQNGGSHFRVIDYKTGGGVEAQDIETGLALQLPLYAIAAERMIFGSADSPAFDAAYWAIRDKGFKPAKTVASGKDASQWLSFANALERYLLAMVDRLKKGDLPLRPRKDDCRSRCDYQFVCRITQSRRGNKVWTEAPVLEVSP